VHDVKTMLGLLSDQNQGVLFSAWEAMSELLKYGMLQEQHDMLRLMILLEDIRQHIIVHGVKTVLGLLGDQGQDVCNSALQIISKLVQYGMFQEQHDMLRLMTPSEDIRQHITAHDIETVLGLLGNQGQNVHDSALRTMSKLVQYGMLFQE
jgi:hypothetical protein